MASSYANLERTRISIKKFRKNLKYFSLDKGLSDFWSHFCQSKLMSACELGLSHVRLQLLDFMRLVERYCFLNRPDSLS